MQRAVVVGAGISGLATAYHLKQQAAEAREPVEVVLLEAGDRVGGNIGTDRFEGFTIENGPNGYLDNVAETRQLVTELGLDDDRQQADASAERRFLFRFGRLHELAASPIAFFRSGVLSLRGRLRVAWEPFAASRPAGKDETVFEFASRRIGPEAASVLVDAMVSGVFAGNVHELSLRSTFPKMAAMEAEYGGLVRAMIAKARAARRARREGVEVPSGGPAGPGGTLTSFRGGLDTLPTRIAERLGDSVRLGHRVEEVQRSEASPHWRIRIQGGREIEADAIVVTLPSPLAAPLLGTFDRELGGAVERIPTAGLAVVALAFDAGAIGGPPHGFGFLVPRGAGPRMLGCLWDSSIFPGRAPDGKVLLRVMIGGAHDPEAVSLDEEQLRQIVLDDLKTTMGLSSEPLWTRLYRYPLGIGQYHVGHQELLDGIHARLDERPGLWLAGSSYYGVSMNACMQKAPEQAEQIRRYLANGG